MGRGDRAQQGHAAALTHATAHFRDADGGLPRHRVDIADANFQLVKADPRHPSLHRKPLCRIWSAGAGKSWRPLAILEGEDAVRFWIGSHADDDKLVK